jgi:hypothetical protein
MADFEDGRGRPLRDVLDNLGWTGEQYLSLVLFYDGSTHPRCALESVAAVTSAGSRVVFICPAAFRATEKRNVRAAETILIHEMLHSLGLREDPPPSVKITEAIWHRCP